jgi:gliding motility-associated protein GldM
MAHERLSPRQKMIGMMYLVLTAMLALNVSKEAVKAFMKVEQSLNRTVKNYDAKNRTIYERFTQAAVANIKKAGPPRDKAFYVKRRADELFEYIQTIKLEIIKRADGEEAVAIQGREIEIAKVLRYDDTNIPSEILIGPGYNLKAYALKGLIEDYRDSLILILGGKNPVIEASLRAGLNTDPGKKEGDKAGTPEEWPTNQFQTLPVVAVVALLTKIQVDVRNAETDVITELYTEIDKESYKFNRLVATVLPVTSTYVMLGSEFEASVFFAAVDTLSRPIVTVGDYVIKGVNSDGSPKGEMVGKNYQTLDYDESGKGVYKIRPNSIGPQEWHGLISMNAPDGSVISKPFSSRYEVGAENVVIAPTAMNILYKGIDNPVDISVPGVGPDKIYPTAKNGKMTKGKVPRTAGGFFGGNYIINPDQVGLDVEVNVTAEINGKQKALSPMKFRVKPIPKPEARFAKKNTGKLDRATALVEKGVFAELDDFDFDTKYTVTEFSVSASIQGQNFSYATKSNVITDQQRDLIRRVVKGGTFIISNIRVQYPDKSIQDVSSIVLTMD